MKLKIPKQCSCVNCRSYYDQKNHHFYQNKIRTGNRRRFGRLFRKLNKQSKDYESIKLPNIEQYSD